MDFLDIDENGMVTGIRHSGPDYINPHRIYTDRLGVSDLERTTDNELVITPTVKESLTTQPTIDIDTGVAGYVEPICSGKCAYSAPVRENQTTALDWFRDEITAIHLWAKDPSLVEPLQLYKVQDARAIAEYFQAAIDALSKTAESAVNCWVGEPGSPAANDQQVKNGTGIEEIELGTLDLQVGTAKPGTETVPNCGTETRQSAEWAEQGVTVTTASSAGAPITYQAIQFPGPCTVATPFFEPCAWCGPGRMGWFSVQFWVRSCYGKRKWMSVTQDYKKKVKFCPMCGRKLEERK